MRINLLGVPFNACRFVEAVEMIRGWVNARSLHNNVIVGNVHLLTEAHKNQKLMHAFENASLAVTDGMPLVWLARKFYPQAERVVGVELMHALCEKGGRIFLLGGAEGVADALGERLRMQYPNLVIAGTACPPFRAWTEEETATLIAQINAAQVDILFVAFGAPKQELWMQAHKEKLHVPVMLGVGAAFDYALGRIARAPRWMQVCGMEWFYRLLQEPKRLFKRYAVSNAKFIWLFLTRRSGPLPSAK